MVDRLLIGAVIFVLIFKFSFPVWAALLVISYELVSIMGMTFGTIFFMKGKKIEMEHTVIGRLAIASEIIAIISVIFGFYVNIFILIMVALTSLSFINHVIRALKIIFITSNPRLNISLKIPVT